MRIFILVLCSLVLVNLNAQVKSTVEMTPAEYQNLMETILKARQKRMQIQRYNMQQYQASLQRPQVAETITETRVEKEEVNEKSIVRESPKNNVQNNDEQYEKLDRQIYELKKELEAMETKLSDNEKDNFRDMGNLERKIDSNRDRTDGKYDEDDIQRMIRNQETMSSELATMQREFDQSPQNIDTKLRELNKEVREMKAAQTLWMATQGQSTDGENTEMSEESKQAMLDWAAKMASLETDLEALKNNEDYARLNKEVDALKNVKLPEYEKTDLSKVNNNMAAMQKEIDELRLQLSQKSVAPPVPTNSKVTMDINTFVTKHRQENIYFGNGSSQLTPAEKYKIQEVANWLKRYSSLDIVIKGFASNVGSKSTNQALSAGRATAVRDYMRSIGITADRMSLEPLGVDSSMSDPASARRAEIHLYISEN